MIGKLSSGGRHTHLGAHHPPSGVTFLTHIHKFSHSIFLPFLHSIYVLISFSLNYCSRFWPHEYEYGASFGSLCPPLMLTLPPFQFRNSILFSAYLVFHLCLHTYLTIWLSSCSVGIFLRSSPLIVKISILSKVSHLKMVKSKIKSHQPPSSEWWTETTTRFLAMDKVIVLD